MPSKVIPTSKAPIRAVRFSEADERLLLGLCELEQLSLSDIVRRSVRYYAALKGVKSHDPKAPRPRKAAKK